MSKSKRRLSVVCSLLLVLVMAMPMFAGCTDKKKDSGKPEPAGPETVCTVTFDKNTSHATNVLQPKKVDNGKTVTPPTVIVTDIDEYNRLQVTGWYTSKDCKENEKWDFTTPVTKSMTLYAGWQEYVKAELYLGTEAATPASTQWIKKGGKAEREDGLVGMYKLEGYFTDTDYNNEFNFDTALNADQKLYLKFDANAAYLTAKYLSAMTFGWTDVNGNPHYIYESKYCETCEKEVVLTDKIKESGKCPTCDTVLTDYEEGTPEYEKQRPEGFYTNSVTKQSETPEDGEAFEYTKFDFGNNPQPYVWYNPLNLDVKGKNMLDITYRNVGKSNKIRFYYVMAYAQEGGGHIYSGGGGFAKMVDVDIHEPDDEWHTATVDMGAKTISNVDGISEWGTADLLSIFRIDYPYGGDHKAANAKPGDSVLEVKEIKIYGDGTDYSAKDTLTLDADDKCTDGTLETTDWVWTVDEDNGAELYDEAGTPKAVFPYGTTANTLTATATETNEIDCDSAEKKALFINYNNLGYGTSATVAWKTSEGTGSKSVSLDARKNGQILYINMESESTWTGILQSLTITYTKKGVDNAITVNSVTVATPEAADIPGISFENGPMGFADEAWSAADKALTVGTSDVTKTAAEGKTVLDVDNAIVYKGFTVWYTQGATAADTLTVSYKDESDQVHTQTAALTAGTGEKSVSVTFLDANNRSAMSGKIKELTLKTDKGSVAVKQVDFDIDVHDSWFDLTKEGTGDAVATATNFGKACSVASAGTITGDVTYSFNDNKNAWQFSYPTVENSQTWWHLNNLLHPVSKDVLKDRKLYLIVNNATAAASWNLYIWFTGSGGAPGTPCGLHTISLTADQKNMGDNEWTVMEFSLRGATGVSNYDEIFADDEITQITGFMINNRGQGNLYIRAIIFR